MAEAGAGQFSKFPRWWEKALLYPNNDLEAQAMFPDAMELDQRLREGKEAGVLYRELRQALAQRQYDEVNALLDQQLWDREVWNLDARVSSEALLCQTRRKRDSRGGASGTDSEREADGSVNGTESSVEELNRILAWDRKLTDLRHLRALGELKFRHLKESVNLQRRLQIAKNAWTVPMGEVLIYHSAEKTPAVHVTVFSKFGREALRIPPEVVLAHRYGRTSELFKKRKLKEIYILVPTEKHPNLDPAKYNKFLQLVITPEQAKSHCADLGNGVYFHVLPLSAVRVENVRHPALRFYVERGDVCFLGIALYSAKSTVRPLDDEPDPAGDEVWSLVCKPVAADCAEMPSRSGK